jgi:hypothetical protein
VPRFHSGLFTTDLRTAPGFYRGAGFVFEKREGEYPGACAAGQRGLLHQPRSLALEEWHDAEIMIDASNQAAALKAFHLMLASIAVYECDLFFLPEPFDVEFLLPEGLDEKRPLACSRPNLMRVCQIAACASRKRSVSYAVHKLHLSLRSACPATIDLDPYHSGPKVFLVQTDPAVHVRYANAIALAYSAIEDLRLEVRVFGNNKQSRMPDGTWNPAVRGDLEARFKASNIDINETHVWTLRGRPTRIEQKKRPPKAVKKSPWSRGAVRDVELNLIDAIALASWLRSKVSTHGFNANVRSLTAYDVHNVQSLARRLVLGVCGCWLRLPVSDTRPTN